MINYNERLFSYQCFRPTPHSELRMYLNTLNGGYNLVHGVADALSRGFKLPETNNTLDFPNPSWRNCAIGLVIPEGVKPSIPVEMIQEPYQVNAATLVEIEYPGNGAFTGVEPELTVVIEETEEDKGDETVITSIDFEALRNLEDTEENRTEVLKAAAAFDITIEPGKKQLKTLVKIFEKEYNKAQ